MLRTILILLFPLLYHPVHVSMSSLTMLPDKTGFELVVRAGSNDIAVEIWRLYQPDEDYFADHMFIGPEQFYQDFVNDNIKVSINSKRVKGELLDVEVIENETIIKLLIPAEKKIKTLNVENNLFTVISPDQLNLFIYKVGEIEKTFRFTLKNNSFSMIE